MRALLLAHLLDDRAGAPVRAREFLQVPCEVILDLALGLGQERQAPAVSKRAGC